MPRDGFRKVLVPRIIDLYEQMEEADALPLGPRQSGYRLKETFGDEEYPKTTFKQIEDTVKRLGQAGQIPWPWIADASSVVLDPGGFDDPEEFLREMAKRYGRDLRQGQAIVMEIYAEASETLPLIKRIAHERGVLVYGGSGSTGPNLAHKSSVRAVRRAVEHGQDTLLAGICDFDLAGVKNVLQPHVENVASFLYPIEARNTDRLVVAWPDADGEPTTILGTDAGASFQHLALTPEQALPLLDDPADRRAVEAYIGSGGDIWSRSTQLLQGVPKIETEALDPRRLRELVIAAIDSTIDTKVLEEVKQTSLAEQERLNGVLNNLADQEAA
jgi:hypothetical protein